ncbi:unnamed protein product [Trifolium pratense]|uniref:Uncharacterized protein n=1 Tax=Trifolium pratense TaxID=57577 RepID=A0ACB0LA12_TRIPR|nr:unnamed protein product [Trifolium pratense]
MRQNSIAKVVFASDQCFALEIEFSQSRVYVAAVYASTAYLVRRTLWADLTRLQALFVGPWLFVGDFNAVLGAHEKRGKTLPPKISCDDFLQWTIANQLSHLNTIGVHFTWSNGRVGDNFVALCLDRAICNHAWLNQWQSIYCYALYKHSSDHHPLVISHSASDFHHAMPFRFFKVWTAHADCERLVKEVWEKQVFGNPMACLQLKLKRLKGVLRVWNKNVFGNVDSNVQLAVDEVMRIQSMIDSNGITDEKGAYSIPCSLGWKLMTSSDQWAVMCRALFLRHGKPASSLFHSSIWHGIKLHFTDVLSNSRWLIGKGDTISFWKDNWLGSSLVGLLNIPLHIHKSLTASVADMIVEGSWIIPSCIAELDTDVVECIHAVVTPKIPLQDRLVWTASKDGCLT